MVDGRTRRGARRLLTLTSLLALVLPVALHASPSGASPVGDWCSTGAPVPCVASATVNGAPVDETDANWDVVVTQSTVDGAKQVSWNVKDKIGDDYELGAGALDDVWDVTLDVGTAMPRTIFTYGTDTTVVRHRAGDGTFSVDVTATPVVVSGGCDQSSAPWTCPTTATEEWNGYLGGQFSDEAQWVDPDQRAAMYGLNIATNISATSELPQFMEDGATGVGYFTFDLANPHNRIDGSTVFTGEFHQRIPNGFLKSVYGIDDPASLTASGLTASVSGGGGSGTINISQEPGGAAMQVDVTGMTFSARQLTVKRGNVRPTVPTALTTKRQLRWGRVSFHASTSRGSKVTGYLAKCTHGAATVTASAKASPISVTGLKVNTSYACTVRALSKAGASSWSAAVTMQPAP
jgi:hypothetical protein